MIYKLCVLWADIWFVLTFIRVKKIYDQPFENHKPHIIVANHISYLDIPMLVKVFRKPLRPLGKVEMTKVPVFGFIYKKAIVTVDRSDSKNRLESLRILRSILTKGISIFVFPEGTFNETNLPLKEFYNGAFKLAAESGVSIQPVLFLDTYKRMNYKSIFTLNPGSCRAVFLETIPVSVGENYQILKEQVFSRMEKRLLHYQPEWVTVQSAIKNEISQ